MNFKYVYSVTDDFPNEKVNIDALTYEIRISDITIALDYIVVVNNVDCEIYFKAELSESEHIILDNIVYEHTGEPLENSLVQDIGIQQMRILDINNNVVEVDDHKRLKVMASVLPKEHELSGPEHLGQLSDDQIPDFIPRDSDLITLSGVLHQDMIEFAANYYTKDDTDALLSQKADLAHDHDLRYYKKTEIDSMIITTHSGLAGLDADDHKQYLNIDRGDSRYFTQTQILSISGSLQNQLNYKADKNHIHDDRYFTESEVTNFLNQKSDINHLHRHRDLLDLDRDDHVQYLLRDGSRSVTGALIVEGDLIVSGTQFISNTETVVVSDNIMLLNSGEINDGVSAIQAGIEIDRGTLDNFRFVFDENLGTFVVGISGAEHPVVIREKNNLVLQEGYVPYFRYNTDSPLPHYELTISGSIHKDNIASIQYVDSTASDLQSAIDTKAPINHTHVESDITDLMHDAVKIRHKTVAVPTPEDDGKRLVYRVDTDSFELESSGYGGGGNSFPFSYFYRVYDNHTSSTTDDRHWKTKLEFKVEIPTGEFRLGWFYQWRVSSTSRSLETRIKIDNGVIIYSKCEPKDYYNADMHSGFKYITLKEGKHTIVLEYKIDKRSAAAYIWNAQMEFWKIN